MAGPKAFSFVRDDDLELSVLDVRRHLDLASLARWICMADGVARGLGHRDRDATSKVGVSAMLGREPSDPPPDDADAFRYCVDVHPYDRDSLTAAPDELHGRALSRGSVCSASAAASPRLAMIV